MFLVYINDLLYELCKSTKGVQMGSLHIPGILLADDTALESNRLDISKNRYML